MQNLQTLFLLIALLAFSACGGASKQVETTAEEPALPEGAIPMHYDRHLVLDAMLSDSIAARLIFDTGNTHLLLDSTFYAEQIGDRVPLLRSMFGGAGDGMESARMAMHEWRYRVGEEAMSERMAVVMNLRKIVGDKADGMFGMNLMQGRRVELNYADGYMRFLSTADSVAQDFVRLPCTWLDERQSRILLPLTLTFSDGSTFSGRFLVDTGMPDALSLNSTTADRLKLHARFPEAVRKTYAVGGVGGSAEEYEFTAKTIVVGGMAVAEVQAAWSANEQGSLSDTRYDGLVGNALLAQFDVIVDFEACAIYLRLNR